VEGKKEEGGRSDREKEGGERGKEEKKEERKIMEGRMVMEGRRAMAGRKEETFSGSRRPGAARDMQSLSIESLYLICDENQ
jgi:hypothetical protein